MQKKNIDLTVNVCNPYPFCIFILSYFIIKPHKPYCMISSQQKYILNVVLGVINELQEWIGTLNKDGNECRNKDLGAVQTYQCAVLFLTVVVARTLLYTILSSLKLHYIFEKSRSSGHQQLIPSSFPSTYSSICILDFRENSSKLGHTLLQDPALYISTTSPRHLGGGANRFGCLMREILLVEAPGEALMGHRGGYTVGFSGELGSIKCWVFTL